MGVNLSDIVSGKPLEISDLKGRTIAIDAYNSLYQFLSIIRDRFTGEPLKDSKGRTTSHLSGLFYRTTKLLENGMNLVYVFDGEPPKFKRKTVESRQAIRKEAREKLELARKEGDVEGIRRYAQATSKLTDEMVRESKDLLLSMGIPVVQAPSEGEAQSAWLVNSGKVWASGSQDWDSLLFGASRMVKNLTITGRRKVPRKEDYVEIRPEMIELDRVLSQLGVDRERLIMIGILIGTDYNPKGVKGIGPKSALKLVREGRSLERVFSKVEWDFETPPGEIFEFFKNPPVEECEIGSVQADFGKLKEIMLDHDFSGERVDKTIERLRKTGRGKQGSLQAWFK
ncbi:MAG: flap endonuclease-1 [Candidatus Aenigmarchaeota archaeon]|nr:flap endonuclease-1 [Candidatus Aenigmarchaeota archaeon]NIP40343.1 flap endonuclease-1 [Candidatus Aenigmarchaeota archaeon]NIQ17837.1 flap endonuclease-1 [Candidatus Aenigmarchaeota archaeon]NIS73218.1 flap endonuclease-1 [Candidatus Aenigmarchaeota archaeon]